MKRAPAAGLLLAIALTAACARQLDKVEWTTRGPSVDDLLVARSYAINGRAPSFDEKRRWESEVEERVFKYLREHPELEQTSRYSDFRFWWHVTTGSTPAEVRVLLEEPQERTVDPARIAVLAARHWSGIQARVTEAWSYPPTWVICFDDKGVIGVLRRVPSAAPND